MWLDQDALDKSVEELVAGDLLLFVWRHVEAVETMAGIADGDYAVGFEATRESMLRLYQAIGVLMQISTD